LTLPYGGSVFQLDQLIVCGEAVFFHEVKHFAGDFVVDGERWFLLWADGGRLEINSPFVQMERAGSYLRRLVADLGYERRVIGRAVFTHEAFALFGAQYEWPLVLPGQVRRYLYRLRDRVLRAGGSYDGRRVRVDGESAALVRDLARLHVENHPYERLPL